MALEPAPPRPSCSTALLLRARQDRARRCGPATFLLDRVAEDMAERLHAVVREFKSGADIGTPGDQVRNALAGRLRSTRARRSAGQESEPLPLEPESLDLAVSALAFQFVNDLPGVLAQIRRALRPDGLLLAAMIGGDTLTELRQSFAAAEAELEGGVSPRVAPFADLRDVGSLLQRAGLALPVTDVDRIVVRYDSAFALMDDLRRMGATNILVERRRTPTRRATMLRMAQIYAERFADADGRIRATFDVIWLSGWAPHESQQKPLKPGSAKAGLAEAVRGGEDLDRASWRAARLARVSNAMMPGMHVFLRSGSERRGWPAIPRRQDDGPLTSTDRSDAGSAECPPAASGSRAVCWRGPRPGSGPRARSRRPPSAGRCRAASADGNHHRRGWRR